MKQFMLDALSGDSRAYQLLLLHSAERLRKYFGRRLVSHPADVEDLVQETLIAIHRKRASYSPALPFSAWLHGIARYRLIDFLRREGIRTTVPLDDAGELSSTEETDSGLAAIDVERLLSELPVKQSEAIRATRLEGLTVREASERTGQSEPAVKVNVHRGLGRLIGKFRSERE